MGENFSTYTLLDPKLIGTSISDSIRLSSDEALRLPDRINAITIRNDVLIFWCKILKDETVV